MSLSNIDRAVGWSNENCIRFLHPALMSHCLAVGQCVPLLGGGAVWVAWQTILPSGFAFQKMKTVSVTGMHGMKVTATTKCSDMCEMNMT